MRSKIYIKQSTEQILLQPTLQNIASHLLVNFYLSFSMTVKPVTKLCTFSFMGVDLFILSYFWSTALSVEKFQTSFNCDLHLPLSIVFWFSTLHPFLRLVMIYTQWWKLQILVFNLGSCRHFLNQLYVFASLDSAHFFLLLSRVLADILPSS